jgi:hypothetical protein
MWWDNIQSLISTRSYLSLVGCESHLLLRRGMQSEDVIHSRNPKASRPAQQHATGSNCPNGAAAPLRTRGRDQYRLQDFCRDHGTAGTPWPPMPPACRAPRRGVREIALYVATEVPRRALRNFIAYRCTQEKASLARAPNKALLVRSIRWQAVAIVALWALMAIYIAWDPQSGFDRKISIAVLIAIPAAVIGVGQLLVSSHVQRAGYIKDYALRFRTDKELTESFHYLVYSFGNAMYEAYLKQPGTRTRLESDELARAQEGVAVDLRFFNPRSTIGAPQERRIDNLLGFFDTIAYDYQRNLLEMSDIAGIFGYYLDHLIQRRVIDEYLSEVQQRWPQAKSFHERYPAPVPFRYLRNLLGAYVTFRKED